MTELLVPAASAGERLDRFLAGPLLDLTDETGRAPGRDKFYE